MRETQDEFTAARQARWDELDRLLGSGRQLWKSDGATISRAANLYRQLCADLTRARTSGYAASLVGYLDALAARGHNAMYGAGPIRLPALWRLAAYEFPIALRKNAAFFWMSLALFGLPCALGLVTALTRPEAAVHFVPAQVLEGMADAYSQGFGEGRATGVNAGMAGFYVYNNVGIAFRCFATGILFGAGTIFFLVYNGLMIGTVTGYVTQAGHGENILTFMCGHGPFELTAIIIAGAAGLKMGYALIETGGRTRIGSLRHQRKDIYRLIVGAALMLFIAAGIEGFWSPSAAPAPVKWAFSACVSALVTGFLIFSGRGVVLDESEQP
jgi:uncharacterized membrane protein SpoIIM required for sporulation